MFLDKTSISDSTSSSSASPLPPTATTNITTSTSGITTNTSRNQLLVNEPSTCQKRARQVVLSRQEQAELSGIALAGSGPSSPSPSPPSSSSSSSSSPSSSSTTATATAAAVAAAAFIQNILLESLLGIKTWLGASVGALWAALSFINHFIESKVVNWLPIATRCGNFRPLLGPTANRQLACRGETSMISFNNYFQQQQQQQSECLLASINSDYLSAVNRARMWSEEAAAALKNSNHIRKHNNNCSSYGSLYGGTSNGINSDTDNDEQHNNCTMDEHRGRIAQRAASEHNNNNHMPAPPGRSLLHSMAWPPLLAPPLPHSSDAFQVQRHAIPAEAPSKSTSSRETTTTSSSNSASRPMEIEVGGAGSCYSLCSNAQQQQHSRQTPNHFQGQSPCCGGGGGRGGRGFQAGSEGALLTTREHEFAQQHKYHHHKQQQQQQQQQQLSQHSYHLQTPLEQKLGLSRALLTSMQKPKNSPEQGPCLAQQQQQQRQANDDDASGSPSRTSRPVGEFHRFSGMYHNGARQIVNTSSSNDGQQADEGNTSPLVLVSKSTLSNLTEQIAFSMNKMKDLEEQVRVIPELQRRLDNVISDTSSSVSGIDSRSSHIELKDSKYFDNNNDSTAAAAEHIINNCNSSGSNRIIGNNLRRGSLTDRSDGGHPFKAMLSSSLRQPYGGSMRCPSGARANGLAQQQQQQQQSSLDHLARSSSVSIGSPFTNGQRYFDRLIRTNNNNSANNGRQSLEMSKALRSTQDSLNSSTNLGPSAKVEYEDLINDLISLSYSVNYLSSNSNSAHSQSSSAGGGGGSSSNHSQVKETHGNKLERPDAIPAYARRHFHSSGNSRQHLTSTQPSNSSNTYHQHHLHSHNNNNNNNNHHHFNQNSTFNASMSHLYSRDNNNSNSYLSRNYGGSGSLSLQTTPVKTQLDCGCQSFKEHLKYNSISREQRLNSAKSHQAISSHSNNSSNNVSPQPSATASTATSANQKVDASTNTDLNMDDIVTKVELNKLVVDIQKTYPATTTTSSSSAISQTGGGQPNRNSIAATRANNISTSPSDAGSSSSSSGSATGPNSSSPAGSRSMSSGDDLRLGDGGDEDDDQEVSDENGDDLKTNSSASARDISDDSEQPKSGTYSRKQSGSGEELSGGGNGDDGDEDDEEEIEVNGNSINGAEEAYSLGSSYQDPSDFEEYCAYGESLDRRTKDFMSQTTKIPNDLRFALIRLNDSIKKKRPFSQIEASSNCIDVIRKEWFEVAASRDAQAIKTKLYVDYFESFTKQLLNMVVNLTDSAGNTAMHYAASHFKLDIIRILLGTKVCDVNCRNKAGYTPIMLLALAELDGLDEQEVARHLFSMGDVNIKARSSGQTALMLAASHGRVSTCKLLLECGADPSLQDYDGSTALMCGSELGNEDVVSCLLAHKLTDPNATDNDGLDALTIAMNNGHKNIGLILYAAKNVPRMTRSSIYPSNPRLVSSASGYLGASLRRSRGKSTMNHVKRADSLLGQRHGRSSRQLEVHHM